MSRFRIYKSGVEFRYSLFADNGENILSGEGYTSKQNCLNGVDSIKVNAAYDARYERRTSISNQPFFVLKASNGEIIAKSQMYSSTYARDAGIEAVKRNAPGAWIDDQT